MYISRSCERIISMNVDKLVEQLLDQGMTEQQIVDLVTEQVIRSRFETETNTSGNQAPDAQDVEVPPAVSAPGDMELVERRSEAAEIVGEVVERLDRSAVDPQLLYDSGAVTESFLMLSERFAGPMPSPRHAEQYERILPGFTDRCLSIHENNSKSVRDSLAISDRRLDRGQLFALIFALACLLSGLGFAFLGHPAAGAAVTTTTLVSVVGAFLYNKRSRRRGRPEDVAQSQSQGELEESDSQH